MASRTKEERSIFCVVELKKTLRVQLTLKEYECDLPKKAKLQLSGRFGERTSDWCCTVLHNSHASLGLSLHTEDLWKLWGFSLSVALTDSDGRHNNVACN